MLNLLISQISNFKVAGEEHGIKILADTNKQIIIFLWPITEIVEIEILYYFIVILI